jgi:hypothetical protein
MDTMTTVESSRKMSNTSYHKRCSSAGQRFWWLRGQDGFVKVPSVRGDSYFVAELDLAPGTYTLGVGPGNSHGIRETITVA